MWRQLAVAVTLISACVPVADEERLRPVQLQQPLPAVETDLIAMNRVTGEAFSAHLGASLDGCRGGVGYLAGAPGINALYASVPDAFFTVTDVDPNGEVGTSVLCDRSQGLGLVGGSNGLHRFDGDGGTKLVFDDAPVLAIAGGPMGIAPLFSVAQQDGGTAIYRLQSAAGVVALDFLGGTDSTTWGAAMAWSPLGDRALVGDSSRARAMVYKQLPDGGIEQNLAIDGGDVMAGFGKVVLMADVTPDPGAELIIAAPTASRVSVYSGGRLRYVLEGLPFTNTGGQIFPPEEFGAALAVEPSLPNRPVAALWVGEPGTNRVYRCLGSECVAFGAPSVTGRFGQTVTFDGRTLVVGAPNFTGLNVSEGAVYEYTFDAGALEGEAQNCDAGLSCTTEQCRPGRCVGGVFCLSSQPPACGVGQVCVSGACTQPVPDAGVDAGMPDAGSADAGARDAGEPDAGPRDAGSEDAGSPDAGEADAGVVDAGVVDGGSTDGGGDDSLVVYRAGCSSAPGTLWVILAALAWRRRRR